MKDLSNLSGVMLLKAIKDEVANAPKGMQTAYFGYYLIKYVHNLRPMFDPEDIAHLCGMKPSYVIEVRTFMKINELMREGDLL